MCATSRQRGIDALDLLVIAHLDSDHSGGAASILAGMRVGAALTSIDAANPSLRGAREVRRCEAGQGFALGAMRVDVLHPLAADYQRRLPSNAESCVLRVRLGPARLLLIGDLPAREDSELAGRENDLFADWVLVPHHGSRSSSSAVLLDAARPRWAGVQAGYRTASVTQTPRSSPATWHAPCMSFAAMKPVQHNGVSAATARSICTVGGRRRTATGTTVPNLVR